MGFMGWSSMAVAIRYLHTSDDQQQRMAKHASAAIKAAKRPAKSTQ